MSRHLWLPLYCLLLLLGWRFLGPAALGGPATYVATHGASMEPGFHTGDLAVLRSADSYEIGDVAAYRSTLLDTVVMHRIVAREDCGFVLQGDNNDWVDPQTIPADQMIGKLALRIPHAGDALSLVTNPWLLGVLAFALVAGGGAVHRRTRRRRRPMSQRPNRLDSTRALAAPPQVVRTIAAAAVLCATAGAVLAVSAWSAPSQSEAAVNDDGPQTMTFSYSTEVERSAAYDDTVVRSPEPVFRAVADDIDVHYTYRGEPGTIKLDAELSTSGGWHSTVGLGPARPFTADKFSDTVPLDVPALEARALEAARVTGIPASDFSVSVRATVRTQGGATFEPAMTLSVTPALVSLAQDAGPLTTTHPANAISAGTTPAVRTHDVEAAGLSLPAGVARWLAAALLATAAVAGAFVIRSARSTAHATEATVIRRRYASLLARVEPLELTDDLVDVAEFATLAKLAERLGLLVLHWDDSASETFVIRDEPVVYRYRSVPPKNDVSSGSPRQRSFGTGTRSATVMARR